MHNQQSQKSPIKTFLTWDDYNRLVDNLIAKLDMDQYEVICGIPRGGAMLGLIMSYKTNTPYITPEELKFDMKWDYSHDVKKILVVDDIIDSGKTMEEYIAKGYETAVIFKSYRCPIDTDYIVSVSTDWIVFPYECEDVEDTVSEVNFKNIDDRHTKVVSSRDREDTLMMRL